MDEVKLLCRYDCRRIIKDTLSRISQLLNETNNIEKIIMDTKLPYLFSKDDFPLTFKYTLTESLFKETYIKFSWTLNNELIPSSILISFNLTENTLDKTVLLIFELEIIRPELISKNYYTKLNNELPKICNEVIEKIIKELEENKKDIYHYESKIMNYPREKIWDILANIHCYMKNQGTIKQCSKEVPIEKKGEEFSFFMGDKCNCEKKLCKLNVNKFKKDPHCNKWVMGYLPVQGPFEHSENYWTLIKLGDNQTMVGNTTIYSDHVTPEDLKDLTNCKNDMFATIENILKNEDNKVMKCCDLCFNKIEEENKKDNKGNKDNKDCQENKDKDKNE